RLKDEGGLKASDKIFLLHATVELFLRLGLALEQDGNLVFPSKFNRQMPPLEEDPSVEVEFGFEGAVENLYTTLVVKLYYGGVFRLKKLWKNAAEFLNGRERVCGFQLHSEGDGRGTLKVFYAEGVSDDDKALFLKIVADHFKEKRVEVQRERIYYCPSCREVVRDNNAARRAKERDRDKIFCQECGGSIPLVDALEMLYRDDQKFLSQIAAMEIRAEASMERGGELVAASAELRTENFKQWAGGADIATVAIVFTDVIGSTKLNVEFGDEHWRQAREAHFAQARELVKRGQGYLIKTIGDSVMAAFHNAAAALDFALALERQTGHESVKIRAGIHIGPVEVAAGDAFGQQVSMAARVEAKAKEGGIWVSAKVKEDVDTLRAAKHGQLKWTEHAGEELSGFPGKWTLWSVE
ncbi:MAG TPA: adenylate/guanylate cyclase domain-containing protein, partial [Pyrinomonadaceae bacterium]|nr:adenylate/guanylate cyclase domain-containing protein [Pyrinomonadaceae bacterium]